MQVRDIMTGNPSCCTADADLKQVASLMVQRNCGAIPVVESQQTMKVVGIVTDRDIVCRTLAEGKNPLQMRAADCMSSSVTTVSPSASLDDCVRLMEQVQVRRIPVVDQSGRCCGIVSQADIATSAPGEKTGEVVEQISKAA